MERELRFGRYGGEYYFAYPKIGMLFQWSTLEKWEDYFPKPRWIMNALHKRKMDPRAAEEELYGTRMPCRNLLDLAEQLVQRGFAETRALEIAREHASATQSLRPFIAGPPHVEARIELWRRVLRDEEPRPQRSKPIVIDGPSQLGKSQWALAQFGAPRTLVVNCQDVKEPPLRHYSKNQELYDAIVLEEANWQLVHRNKMLFQSTNSAVDMASSATNCFGYRLRVHCVPMFILSNEFYSGIDKQAPEKLEYLQKNVEYWRIDSPLYEVD